MKIRSFFILFVYIVSPKHTNLQVIKDNSTFRLKYSISQEFNSHLQNVKKSFCTFIFSLLVFLSSLKLSFPDKRLEIRTKRKRLPNPVKINGKNKTDTEA